MDQFGLSNLLHGVPWSLLYFIRLRWDRCGGFDAYNVNKVFVFGRSLFVICIFGRKKAARYFKRTAPKIKQIKYQKYEFLRLLVALTIPQIIKTNPVNPSAPKTQ